MFTVRMKVGEDGSIYLKGPPLKPGQSVEVHVKEVPERKLTEAEMEEFRQWGKTQTSIITFPLNRQTKRIGKSCWKRSVSLRKGRGLDYYCLRRNWRS